MTNNFNFILRPIASQDISGARELYRYFVEGSTISFEYEIPSEIEWEDRVRTITLEYPWLVIELEKTVIGYAYASKHRYRTAYSWSVESTVYMNQNFQELGFGKVLCLALFDILKLQEYRNVYAGITLPNSKSVRLHKSMGFYEVGVFKNIGFKFGAWYDTA